MLLNERPARALLAGIAAGEISAEAVMAACLARIAEREAAVGAWEYLDPDAALRSARARDAGAVRGPLHGLPVGIKDIMDTADMPTAYGSPIYAGNRPAADAACVALLRAAGAVVVGKTVTTEFATMHAGKTRHPLSPERTPGGSSSGSAAAVGDAMVPIALGTQTMGSVIRPAAYCGAVGFKPSFGSINRAGIKSQAESVDTIGVMGRSVDAVALVGAVLAGAEPSAFERTRSRPPRFGVYRGPDWSTVEPAADAALDAAAQRFAAAGADVRAIDPHPLMREALDAHFTIVTYELARALAYEWAEHRGRISDVLGAMIERGRATSYDAYLAAQTVAGVARQWISESFADLDAWLTVSAAGEAPLGTDTGNPVLNRVWTLLHVPVFTLPAGSGPNGFPLGIQVIGPYRHDAELTATARWAEAQLLDA